MKIGKNPENPPRKNRKEKTNKKPKQNKTTKTKTTNQKTKKPTKRQPGVLQGAILAPFCNPLVFHSFVSNEVRLSRGTN